MSFADLFEWCARGIGVLLGIALLYAALFMLPAEQQQAQSRLENWWQHMRDVVRARVMTRQLAFIRETAKAAGRGFEWLFGELLSVRFFVVSGLFSMVSFVAGMLLFGDYGWAISTGLLLFVIGTIWLAFVGKRVSDDMEELRSQQMDSLVAAVRKARSLEERRLPFADRQDFYHAPRKPWWQDGLDDLGKDIPSYIAIAILGSSGTLVFKEALDKGINGWVFGSATFVSFVCDVIAIGVTMFALERIASARNGVHAAGWLFLDATVAAAMVGVPWAVFVQLDGGDTPLRVFLLFVAAANMSTALPAVAYVLVAATLLLHRMLWEILLRPFYNLFIDSKILQKRKTLGSGGVALLGASWPSLSETLLSSVKQIIALLA